MTSDRRSHASTSSPSVDRIDPAAQPVASFKRSYVACLPCRQRKVRCVLGSEPPCAKCRREHRECTFQSPRKSLRHREPPKWARLSIPTASQDVETVTMQDGSGDSAPPSTERLASDESTLFHNSPAATAVSGSGLDGFQMGARPSPSDRVLTTVATRQNDVLEALYDAAQMTEAISRDTVQTLSGAQGVQDFTGSQRLVGLTPASTHASTVGKADDVYTPIFKLSQASEDVLDMWERCRFVRQGWFTAQEAVTYLDLFFERLAPLSPVLTDEFRHHDNHHRLITEESMLCVTLLMISSRFHTLPGPGGTSRGQHIHQRLWQHCDHLIRRLMLGQEKLSTAKTRVVGSIESLILISEWHPRALHFPPETEGWDAELCIPEHHRHRSTQQEGEAPFIRWRDDVFEPAIRSDRMSWMLLGAATNLAYEIGVFSDEVVSLKSSNEASRFIRARKLLQVYVMQQAVRLGCWSLLPDNLSTCPSLPVLTTASTPANEQWEAYMDLSTELTRLTKTAFAMFFQSTAYTKQQLLNGHYHVLLQHFSPSLSKWYKDFDATSSVQGALRDLLFIEFHHLKVHVNALAIQAVVERAIVRGHNSIGRNWDDILLSCISIHDSAFVREVVVDTRKILRTATKLAQAGVLRYTPIRVLSNITSASVFLLKAISLGTRNSDLQESLNILEEATAALRASPIDDMDFSSRYATLLQKHVERFRANFIVPHPPDCALSVSDPPSIDIVHGVGNVEDPIRSVISADLPACEKTGDKAGAGTTQDFDMSGYSQAIIADDDWWARPFDPSIAPFSTSSDHMTLGFDLDSLDFLWNLPSTS